MLASFISTLGWIAAGVIGLVAACLLLMVLGTVYAHLTGVAPKGIKADAVAPTSCAAGARFELVVTVRDTLGRRRTLRSVDIDTTYLRGVAIESITPLPSDMGTSLGVTVHTMKLDIPPSGAVEVRFSCRALHSGDYAGDVTVYVDGGAFRYVACPIRTAVA